MKTNETTGKQSVPIGDRMRESCPPEMRLGSFTKPASPVCESIDAAIAACNCPTYKGDFLVKPASSKTIVDGWQVWMRRANARGGNYPGDYERTFSGRRAKRICAGEGKLFILQQH